MDDVPYLSVTGFPFRNGDGVAKLRILVSALDPRPDKLVEMIDPALAFATRYWAAAQEVEGYDSLVRAFSPLEVEEFRKHHEDRIRHEMESEQRYARRPLRPNIFAPADGLTSLEASSFIYSAGVGGCDSAAYRARDCARAGRRRTSGSPRRHGRGLARCLAGSGARCRRASRQRGKGESPPLTTAARA